MWQGGQIHAQAPASGLVTAMDPVMRACGGVWVAHGSGDADRETADTRGRLGVPVDDPRYTRFGAVWLTKEEEQGYYAGFSNEGSGRSATSCTRGRIFPAGQTGPTTPSR